LFILSVAWFVLQRKDHSAAEFGFVSPSQSKMGITFVWLAEAGRLAGQEGKKKI
jgi:hypothetical protein